MTWTPESIPVWLRRTPEQQAADLALQDRLRQARGPGRRPNRTEAQLLRADAIKRSASAQLEHLREDPNANPQQVEAAAAQMADALAMEGNFTDAAKVHPNKEHAARFQAIAEAVERDDSERCDCPITTAQDPVSNRTINLSPDMIEEMVFSKKHGKLLPLVACSLCGFKNVKPAPEHLQERINRVRQEHTNARRMK